MRPEIIAKVRLIRRFQSGLENAYAARRHFDKSWLVLLANQPEYFELLQRIQSDLNEVVEIALRKIDALENEISHLTTAASDTANAPAESGVEN